MSPRAMSPLTTHVLDTSTGLPASGMRIELARHEGGAFVSLCERSTDTDGRVRDFLASGELALATYRLRFFTEPFFTASGRSSFFPWVDVVFTVHTLDRHHVPLLVSAFGYSTYRGS
jgi:5-hydroxyisourate hydrolase